MSVKIELHNLGDERLLKSEKFTYSHDIANVAKVLNVTLMRDFSREFEELEADDELTLDILGNRETFCVTDTDITNFTQSVTLLSKDIKTAYRTASKELRFMSMNALEEKEFRSYINQPGSDVNYLPYQAYIKRFSYIYKANTPVEVDGGWWAYGDSDGVLENLAGILGLKVVCTLPAYRVRQFSVPEGSSIYQAMIELVSVFAPNIFIKNGTLYILEPNRSFAWTGKLKIKAAEEVTEKRYYKENTNPEDVILQCGSGSFNVDRYEGPIFPEALVTAFAVTAPQNAGDQPALMVDMGTISLVTYGEFPDPEYTIQYLDTPGSDYRVSKASEVYDLSVWDIFHSRKIRYYSLTNEWGYNSVLQQLVPINSKEDYFRYRYLESCYESPRLDSGGELTVYPMLEAGLDIPEEIRTTKNWCRMSRTKGLQWQWDPAKQDYAQSLRDNSEIEMEWRFYDKYGRLALRSTKIYSDIHTINFIPYNYEEFMQLPESNRGSMQWRKYNSLTYNEGAQLSGTLIRVIPDLASGTLPFDERTIVSDTVERFIPMGKKRYKIDERRTFLDESFGRRRVENRIREVSSEEVETTPIKPKENQIVIKHEYRKENKLRDKPTLHISAPNVWIESEAEEIYEFIKRHIAAQEIERTINLPYSLFIPKGAVIEFGEMVNFEGKVIIPDRNILGNVVGYTCNVAAGGATTTITAKGIYQP